MVDLVRRRRRARSATSRAQARFLKMLPAIRRQARLAFRHLALEQREEQIAEVIANCYCALVGLAQRGRLHRAFATPLASYAIRQVRAGRQVGTKLNVRDISSRYCQRRKQFSVDPLDCFDRRDGEWLEIVIEDRHAGPADTAAARIDVAAWLGRLPSRNRRIAEALAVGDRTREVACRFGLSPARISQLRREFAHSWIVFQGEV